MLEGLNTEQKLAVMTPGHVLLTACPGSGKTRVLTFKVAFEIQNILESKKIIIAVTFTNRAADEIKGRLIKMNTDPNKLWAGTIHSFCLEWILRPYAGYLDELKNGFVIADEYKTEEIINSLKEKYGLETWIKISTRINSDGTLEEIEQQRLVIEYHKILTSYKLIDFDQILYLSYKLLSEQPKISKTLNNLIHVICVDEYQDTQRLQYAILAEIIKVQDGKTFIFMVGDSDQAIYGSLGGVAKSLEEISIEFGNINITHRELAGNYRSNQRIIDYYRNFQSADIPIKSLCDYSESVGVISFKNQTVHRDNLDVVISRIISESLASGIKEHEICVLAPQWWLIIPMGRKLKNLLPNVNFDALGLSPLLKNKENIWFKIARLFLVEPSPNIYLVRNRWALELIKEFESIGAYLFEEDDRKSNLFLRAINSIKSDQLEGLDYLEDCFYQLLDKFKLNLNDYTYLKLHWEYFFIGSRKRLENPDFDFAKDIKSYKKLFTHNSGVVVNTCHGIKGEEFQTVIAFGLLHGYIPNWNEDDAQNSARKLLYVICSRAKNYLYLISENGRTTRRNRPYVTTSLLQQIQYSYD